MDIGNPYFVPSRLTLSLTTVVSPVTTTDSKRQQTTTNNNNNAALEIPYNGRSIYARYLFGVVGARLSGVDGYFAEPLEPG
jgi:hypothetical protein